MRRPYASPLQRASSERRLRTRIIHNTHNVTIIIVFRLVPHRSSLSRPRNPCAGCRTTGLLQLHVSCSDPIFILAVRPSCITRVRSSTRFRSPGGCCSGRERYIMHLIFSLCRSLLLLLLFTIGETSRSRRDFHSRNDNEFLVGRK